MSYCTTIDSDCVCVCVIGDALFFDICDDYPVIISSICIGARVLLANGLRVVSFTSRYNNTVFKNCRLR